MNPLPEGWQHVALGHVANFMTGFPFSSSGFVSGGVKLVRGSNVKRAELDWSPDIARYWPQEEHSLRHLALAAGDIVIAMDGALVGRSYARISECDLPAYLVQRVACLRGVSIDQGLIYAWIGSSAFAAHVDSVKTHTAIPHISPRDIRDFVIAIPTSPGEQREIARVLEDVGNLIARLERLVVKKEEIKRGLMQQLLSGETRLSGFSRPWVQRTLGDLAHLTMGQSPPSASYNHDRFGLPLVQGNSDIRDRRTIDRLWTTAPTKTCAANDILLTVRAPVGFTAVASNDSCLGRGICALRAKGSNRYLFHALVYAETEWTIYEQGSTFAAVDSAQVRGFKVFLPEDEAEQTAIAGVLDEVEADVCVLRERLEKTKAIKQSMMQELLTGRTRLPVAEALAA